MEMGSDEIDVKQTLLITAGRIFASKGFAASKVRDICKQAGVNLAAVNYYFGDKENLYYEAVAFARKSRVDEIPLPELSRDPETCLRQFILTLVNRTAGINEAPWEVQLILREVLYPTEACRRLVEEYFRPFFNQLLDILQKFSPEGLKPEMAYRLGYSIVGQVMYLRFTSKMKSIFLPEGMAEQHFQNEQIAEHIYQFSVAALKSEQFWDLAQKTQEPLLPDLNVSRTR